MEVPPANAKETVVYIALGSNQGERWGQLREAVRRMGRCLTVERLSQVYETEPAYVNDQPRYLNMVLQARTVLDPQALLDCLKAVERDMGRAPGLRWGPRPIDLDILLFGDLLVESPDLHIPHARLHERPFVLRPLAELAPSLVPSGLTMTVGALARQAPPVGEIVACLGLLSPPEGT